MKSPKKRKSDGSFEQFLAKNKVGLAIGAIVVAVVMISSGGNGSQPDGKSGLPPVAGSGQPSSVPGMRTHSVVDQSGFEKPMEAAQILVPEGWQVSSEVRWDGANGQCSAGMASPSIRMASADGRESIELLPGFIASTWPDPFLNRGMQPGDYCVIAKAANGEEMIRNVAVPRLRPGATVEALRQVPVPASVTQMIEQQRRMGGGGSFDAYGIEATLRSADGQSREKLTMTGTVFALPAVVPGIAPLVMNHVLTTTALKAPPERLAQVEAYAATILANVRSNPEWTAAVGKARDKINGAVSKGISERSRPVGGGGAGGTGGTGGGVDMDEWRRRGAADDRQQRDRIDSIREVERCYDPETGTTREVSIHVGC